MLTNISPQQTILQESDAPSKAGQEGHYQAGSEQDGIDIVMGDRDETVAEMEEADIDEGIAIDMDAPGDIAGTPETSSPPVSHS